MLWLLSSFLGRTRDLLQGYERKLSRRTSSLQGARITVQLDSFKYWLDDQTANLWSRWQTSSPVSPVLLLASPATSSTQGEDPVDTTGLRAHTWNIYFATENNTGQNQFHKKINMFNSSFEFSSDNSYYAMSCDGPHVPQVSSLINFCKTCYY